MEKTSTAARFALPLAQWHPEPQST